MNPALLSASFLFFLVASAASAVEVKSPSGNLVVLVDVKDFGNERACPFYRVTYLGQTVLADSRLGLNLEPDPLAANLEITGVTSSRQDTTWRPVCGERELVHDHYNALQVDLKEKSGRNRRLHLTFRAYDEGIAFCYTVPAQPNLQEFTIIAERTQFAFTADHSAWAVYRAQASYAGGAVPISQIKPGAERPLTIQLDEHLFAAVTEARCVDYARMKLRLAEGLPNALEPFLDAERGQATKVTGTAPFNSPWRVIMVAESAGKLLENNDLILNLNDPCALADTSWIKPGKVMRDTTLSTAGSKACVDFCSQRGLQYVLFDAGWYGPESDDKSDASAVDPKRAAVLNLDEVIRYGREKGIGIILYVNRRALEKQIDQIFPLYQKWGVKGVKFGFVNVGSQKWTSWVHEAIRKAAVHHLMVDIHDEFRDTGYRRTYPNLMTVEGIGGNEEFPSPVHNAALPFTRFLTGPADYTYCWYIGKLKVTHAHQLALSTIFFSPWQVLYWYDKPGQYRGEPELDYWKELPTCWDETRVLRDQIGQCASIARRRGPVWFVGAINPAGGEVQLPLSFLQPGNKYKATVYSDRDPDDPASKAVKMETIAVDSTTILKPRIPANGGQAIRIAPAETNADSTWRQLPLIQDGHIHPDWRHVGWGGFVVDGDSLRAEPAAKGLGLLVYQKERFGNCQIRVLFKSKDAKSNSGVIVRIADGILDQVNRPGAAFDRNASGKISPASMQEMMASADREEGPWFAVHRGYEVQIMDANDKLHRTGAVYSLASSSAISSKPPGEWKTMIITLAGNRIYVDIDGQRVTSFDPEGRNVPRERKWFEPKRSPPRPETGYLGLQNHDPGDIVWFKEISVRP